MSYEGVCVDLSRDEPMGIRYLPKWKHPDLKLLETDQVVRVTPEEFGLFRFQKTAVEPAPTNIGEMHPWRAASEITRSPN